MRARRVLESTPNYFLVIISPALKTPHRRVLKVNDARVDDLDLFNWSELRGLSRQREVRGELGRRYGRGRRTFGERNDRGWSASI